MGRVVTRDELKRIAEEKKSSSQTIVTTNGCFDILHVGHVRILKKAKELGDVLVVGINSDASVKRLKGPQRPHNTQEDRAEILSSLECVDYVTVFGEDTPVEFLEVVKPNIHVKGSDYKPSDLAETPVVERGGGQVKIVELVPNKSTTGLIEKIKSTD